MITLWILTYIAGWLTFITGALFDEYHSWDTAYYIWASFAHGGVFAWWALYVAAPSWRLTVLPVAIFASAISLWEVVSVITGIDINNPYAVGVQFLVMLGVITYYLWSSIKHAEKS